VAVTQSAAKTAARVVLATAGATAAYVVITTPPLRRLALQGIRWWLGASVPVYLLRVLRQSWTETGRTAAA